MRVDLHTVVERALMARAKSYDLMQRGLNQTGRFLESDQKWSLVKRVSLDGYQRGRTYVTTTYAQMSRRQRVCCLVGYASGIVVSFGAQSYYNGVEAQEEHYREADDDTKPKKEMIWDKIHLIWPFSLWFEERGAQRHYSVKSDIFRGCTEGTIPKLLIATIWPIYPLWVPKSLRIRWTNRIKDKTNETTKWIIETIRTLLMTPYNLMGMMMTESITDESRSNSAYWARKNKEERERRERRQREWAEREERDQRWRSRPSSVRSDITCNHHHHCY